MRVDVVVFVSGRFRGSDHWQIEQHVRQAESLALEVWRLGAAALCPHLNTRHFQGSAPDALWLAGDLRMLERCDAVLTVQNWRDSIGARAEVQHAQRLGIPVFHALHELQDWLARQKETSA